MKPPSGFPTHEYFLNYNLTTLLKINIVKTTHFQSGNDIKLGKAFLCVCSDDKESMSRKCDWKNSDNPTKLFGKAFFKAQSNEKSRNKCQQILCTDISCFEFFKKEYSLRFQNKVHHQNLTINCFHFFLLQTRGRLGTGPGPCPGFIYPPGQPRKAESRNHASLKSAAGPGFEIFESRSQVPYILILSPGLIPEASAGWKNFRGLLMKSLRGFLIFWFPTLSSNLKTL